LACLRGAASAKAGARDLVLQYRYALYAMRFY
jgi:hypothetical protein